MEFTSSEMFTQLFDSEGSFGIQEYTVENAIDYTSPGWLYGILMKPLEIGAIKRYRIYGDSFLVIGFSGELNLVFEQTKQGEVMLHKLSSVSAHLVHLTVNALDMEKWLTCIADKLKEKMDLLGTRRVRLLNIDHAVGSNKEPERWVDPLL